MHLRVQTKGEEHGVDGQGTKERHDERTEVKYVVFPDNCARHAAEVVIVLDDHYSNGRHTRGE